MGVVRTQHPASPRLCVEPALHGAIVLTTHTWTRITNHGSICRPWLWTQEGGKVSSRHLYQSLSSCWPGVIPFSMFVATLPWRCSRLKQVCLPVCRSPLTRYSAHRGCTYVPSTNVLMLDRKRGLGAEWVVTFAHGIYDVGWCLMVMCFSLSMSFCLDSEPW